LEGRGAGIVIRPTTVRYLVERAGKRIGDIGTAECAFGRVAEFEGTSRS